MQIKRVILIPCALRGHPMWEDMGAGVGFHKTGDVTVAFNSREADLVHARQTPRAEVGAPFEFISLQAPRRAERLAQGAGGWLRPSAQMLAVDLPVQARINAVSITERMPPLMTDVVGHATGLLTMKHWPNCTVPVGGG